jgi:hypothetical protein
MFGQLWVLLDLLPAEPALANGGGSAPVGWVPAAGGGVAAGGLAELVADGALGAVVATATFAVDTTFAWLVVVAAPAVAALRPTPKLSPAAASTPSPTTYRFFDIALPSLREPHPAGSALLSRAKLGGPSERAGGVELSSMAR